MNKTNPGIAIQYTRTVLLDIWYNIESKRESKEIWQNCISSVLNSFQYLFSSVARIKARRSSFGPRCIDRKATTVWEAGGSQNGGFARMDLRKI